MTSRRRATLKEVVNEALRQGLRQMTAPAPPGAPYRARTVAMGRCLVGDRDNVLEVLAGAEGESFSRSGKPLRGPG